MTQLSRYCAECSDERLFEQFHAEPASCPDAPDGKDVTLALVTGDAGDGNERDFVLWQQPRLIAPGRPDLLLRDVRQVSRDLARHRPRAYLPGRCGPAVRARSRASTCPS